MPEKLNRAKEHTNLFLSRNWVKINKNFTKLNDTIQFIDQEVKDPTSNHFRGGYSVDEGKKRIGNKFSVFERELRRAILDLIRKTRKRNQRRGKIDAPRLFRAGADVDLKVFYEPAEVLRISSAFSLLIDLSGSMGGSKLDVAGDLGMIFGHVLSRLRIPFEVAGFDGEGHYYDSNERMKNRRVESVRYIVYKNFKNRWQNRINYLNTMQAGGCTPTHDAVAIALGRLMAMKEKKRVLMVITDGEPALSNVPDYRLRRELQVTQALAKRHDIKVIGMGPDYIQAYNAFKDFVSVHDFNDLTQVLFNRLKELLLSEALKMKMGLK